MRRLDRSYGWRRPEGHLWINVVGVADGSIGMDGRPGTADEVVGRMTAECRARTDAAGAGLPEGVTVDPMCGMRVRARVVRPRVSEMGARAMDLTARRRKSSPVGNSKVTEGETN
ncbi:hypothetical protein ACFYN5_05665 [Streptomyces sp. NPDC007126]|uniref:hypothetical protein n=1 Tax=Streptomyces sp. NPDC007126 TaxID=3364774 RepID=UPI003697237C